VARGRAEAEAPSNNRRQRNKRRSHHQSRGAGKEEQDTGVQVDGRRWLDKKQRWQRSRGGGATRVGGVSYGLPREYFPHF
jgi:hypothetical protein